MLINMMSFISFPKKNTSRNYNMQLLQITNQKQFSHYMHENTQTHNKIISQVIVSYWR